MVLCHWEIASSQTCTLRHTPTHTQALRGDEYVHITASRTLIICKTLSLGKPLLHKQIQKHTNSNSDAP